MLSDDEKRRHYDMESTIHNFGGGFSRVVCLGYMCSMETWAMAWTLI